MTSGHKLTGEVKQITSKCKSFIENQSLIGNKGHVESESSNNHSKWGAKKILLLIFFLGWILIAIYAFTNGNIARLLHPTNSKGDTCGQAGHVGKPNILYLDLTRCAGLQADECVCPTSSVCVKECPKTYWTPAQGMIPELEQLCDGLSGNNEATLSISQLAAERSCPAYVLPSTSVIGRCIPFYGSEKKKDIGRAEAKLKSIKTAEGKNLHRKSLLGGVEYALGSINDRGHDEKLLASHAYYALTYILAMLLSTLWTVFFTRAPKAVIWTSVVFSLVLSIAGAVVFMTMGTLAETNNQDQIFLPSVIINLSNNQFNKNWCLSIGIILGITAAVLILLLMTSFNMIKDSISLISDDILGHVTSRILNILLVQTMQSWQLLAICFHLRVASYLSTIGSPLYRVVDACSSEICANLATFSMFKQNDICDPQAFSSCTGCPESQCVFHRFEPASYRYVLQAYNFCAMVLMVLSVRCLMSRAVPDRAIDKIHLVSTAMKVFVLLTVKLTISGIAVGAAKIFASYQSSSEIQVNYEMGVFLAAFLGTCTFTASFLDIILFKNIIKLEPSFKSEQRNEDNEIKRTSANDSVTTTQPNPGLKLPEENDLFCEGPIKESST